MPQRMDELQCWLSGILVGERIELTPASGDASFRRYFRQRLNDGRSLIVMDAPPDKEDCRPFVEVTRRLAAAGVHVPEIHALDLQQGFMLLEDLGERLYLDALDANSVQRLYPEAVAAMLQFQCQGEVAGLPLYDEALLRREMQLFPDWLLQQHLGLQLSEPELALLDEAFDRLVHSALEQPKVLVHRDYHSRNLLVLAQQGPGIIDYQDAVRGPLSYDLVSLLRDCYIAWPEAQVDVWLDNYADRAIKAGLLTQADRDALPRWFDLMGVQRHLKASGIFARLWHRDGKSGYLADIPRTLDYIVAVGRRRPEMAGLASFIASRVLPGL